ncbi:hypothetical protein C8Q77DRAFT_1065176 [Trametes polyzona]|nr:hypothetical protein C8Q77DRAFT_1065176 [Trametes polyzona]
MPNPAGKNGHDNGVEPTEEVLRAELLQYAKERLPLERRTKRLAKLGYYISISKLKRLNKQYNIPSARNPPPMPVATAIVMDKVAEDVQRRNGPNEITKMIAAEGLYVIPRDMTRQIMHDNDEAGFELRYRAHRPRIPHGVLKSHGLNSEVSADGHEKFSSLALRMGPVGFGIYGFREKLSGKGLHLVVVPNARKSSTIGHVYLDMVALHGYIGRQLTVDHGSETGEMYAIHMALRQKFAPELDEKAWPPFVALKSTNNITIENLWSRWLKTSGRNCREVISEGNTNGLFNPLDDLDVDLFQWLWPQVVQVELDKFVQYWNCHTVRCQKDKAMPSGTTPMDVYCNPEEFGYQDLRIPVDVNLVEHLRKLLPDSREEVFRFVSDDFRAAAEQAYAELGCPPFCLKHGWEIYKDIQLRLRAM